MENYHQANQCLQNLRHLEVGRDRKPSLDSYRLWLPDEVSASFNISTQSIVTQGLGELDKKHKDLIEVVVIEDALSASYAHTGILIPRTFAESLPQIPFHVTTQAIIFARPEEETPADILKMSADYSYGCTPNDRVWLGGAIPQKFNNNDVLMVLNRRIGGWDGAPERPVIELLGAGGHVPVIWDCDISCFRPLTPEETLKKEILEEIGLRDFEYNLVFVGGFINSVTSELVILFATVIPWKTVISIQKSAYGNTSENIDGIYLGTYRNIIDMYKSDASLFAGGVRAKETNFPSNEKIMSSLDKVLIGVS